MKEACYNVFVICSLTPIDTEKSNARRDRQTTTSTPNKNEIKQVAIQ